MTERLHKRIASSGYCSRRAAEKLIAEGLVKVNGEVIDEQGVQVSEKDKIEIRGKQLNFSKKKTTIAFYKPIGVVTTRHDPDGAKTVMDLLPKEYQQLNPVGRLDRDSEGLLLFTNDGDLLLKLTHPRYEHEKTYEVGVRGVVEPSTLEQLEEGVVLDEEKLEPMRAEIIKEDGLKTWLRMILKEGRRRQIRRVMEQFGHTVFSLKRVAIGKLELGELKTGLYRSLTPTEIKKTMQKSSL